MVGTSFARQGLCKTHKRVKLLAILPNSTDTGLLGSPSESKPFGPTGENARVKIYLRPAIPLGLLLFKKTKNES